MSDSGFRAFSRAKVVRLALWVGGVVVLVAVVVGGRFVLAAAPAGVGLAAKQLCSLVYVSGLDPDMARSLYVDETVSPMDVALSVSYDDVENRVETRGLGLWTATAEMRDGVGCTLTTALDDTRLDPIELTEVQDKPLPTTAPDDFAVAFDVEAVENALDAAFAPSYNTLAIVVLHGGELVTERYARGVDAATPLPGWSIAKSVTATLVGLLVEKGRLDVTEPDVIEEWADDTDGGADVTIDHLLRMTSGLDVVEDQSGADPNSRMLFVEPDTAAYAAGRGLSSGPGAHWEYMSGSTVLVSREVVEASGGTLASSQRFIRQELLEPLGAASFVVEPAAAGTFIGSSFMLASAQDWAKLGQLYLDDGVWRGNGCYRKDGGTTSPPTHQRAEKEATEPASGRSNTPATQCFPPAPFCERIPGAGHLHDPHTQASRCKARRLPRPYWCLPIR